jgi:hypothetical protein
LPERFDLAKRDFGEGHCAFMFVEHVDHFPNSGQRRPSRSNDLKLSTTS